MLSQFKQFWTFHLYPESPFHCVVLCLAGLVEVKFQQWQNRYYSDSVLLLGMLIHSVKLVTICGIMGYLPSIWILTLLDREYPYTVHKQYNFFIYVDWQVSTEAVEIYRIIIYNHFEWEIMELLHVALMKVLECYAKPQVLEVNINQSYSELV